MNIDIKKLKKFFNKYDENTKVTFGINDGNTGEWHEFKVEFLCDLEEMGDSSIGIELEENDEYNKAKQVSIIEDLREAVISAIDRY